MSDPAVSQGTNQDLIPRHNPAEGVAVARQAARHQFRIRELFGHCLMIDHTARYVPDQAQAVTENFGKFWMDKTSHYRKELVITRT
jgi:hypothetical protein